MGNIKFKLNLNKHPKDCEDYSMIHAQNVRVSDDFSCLQSEESIIKHIYLTNIQDTHKIIGYIPCNTELILFAVTNEVWESGRADEEVDAVIFRYSEQHPTDTLEPVYTNLKYHWGKIKGTFTYNINSELIIAFSEYDGLKEVPLKTINLGTWKNRIDYLEKDFVDDKLAISPTVKIPFISNFNYINGRAYKGWYHFFIRYKINDYDYTQWFSFGYPIFVCSLEKYSLIKYGFANKSNNITTYKLGGVVDCISDDTDIAKETISLELSNINNELYSKCQIGFVCVSNEYNKSYRSNDIDTEEIINYTVNISNSIECSAEDFIINNNNYYNVKNLVNYRNRLYISNYKENEILDIDTKEIKIKIKSNKKFTTNDLFTQEISTFLNNDFINIHEVETEGYKQKTISPPLTFTSDTDFTNIILNNDNSIVLPRLPEQGIHTIKGIATDSSNNSFGAILNLYYYANTSGSVISAELHINFNGVVKTTRYRNNNNPITTINYLNGEKYINSFTIYPNNVFIKTSNSFNERKKNTTLLPDSIYAFYIHFINKFGEYTRGYLVENTDSDYSGCEIFINSQGKKLFKTPKSDFNNWVNTDARLYTFYFNLEDFEIPNDYIGYFFSYEKFEPRIKHEGIITKYDNFNYASLYTVNSSKKNYIKYRDTLDENLDVLHFYCPDLDINEAFDLDFNKLRVYTKVTISDNSINNEENLNESVLKNLLSAKYPATYNSRLKISKEEYPYDSQYFDVDINNEDILVSFAGDGKTNKFNRGTSIIIKINDQLRDKLIDFDGTYDCVAQVYKESEDYYVSNEKILNRLGNIYYNNTLSDTIEYGLPGCLTWQSILHYNYNGFKLGIHNEILTENDGSYYDFGDIIDVDALEKSRPPLMYIHQLIYDTKFNEAKSIKNNPEYSLLRIEEVSTDENQVIAFANNILVAPNNSIDLFRNKYPNCYELVPKTYSAYDNKIYITKFDKRVQRSNVISDESLNNSWRTFPVEGYKDISENKGNITNLLGIGLTLLVHTEHSLFMFDRNNTLQNGENEEIRLAIPDAFDIDYREVFTSDLGVCGLQDEKAWIAGQFGYVFYDNDAHRFYKFSGGKVEFIDYSIVQFLNIYLPYHVRFAHDKERNRILVCFYEVNNLEFTLSYNYILKEWISFHSYRFSEACNTKNFLYLFEGLNENVEEYVDRNNIYSFELDLLKHLRQETNSYLNLYLTYENTLSDLTTYAASVYIIVHGDYNKIKTFEYLMYKLFKRGGIKHSDYSHWAGDERESAVTPYSGYQLRIYNDLVNTGLIDVSVDSESDKNKSPLLNNYKKPWWELGNWNFNYLRDINQGSNHDIMARLYGNYFVIAIELNKDEQTTKQNKLELEDIEATIITDETV